MKSCRLLPISSPVSRTKIVSSVALPSVPAAARTRTTRWGVSRAGYAGTLVEKNAPVMSIRVAGPATCRKSMASTNKAATISMTADLTCRSLRSVEEHDVDGTRAVHAERRDHLEVAGTARAADPRQRARQFARGDHLHRVGKCRDDVADTQHADVFGRYET